MCLYSIELRTEDTLDLTHNSKSTNYNLAINNLIIKHIKSLIDIIIVLYVIIFPLDINALSPLS